MKIIAIFLLSLFCVSLAYASDEAFQKYRNYTPDQILKLTQKARSEQVPIVYNMAAQRGLVPGAELLFGMQLNALMYPGLHDYQAAVKAFQSDVGDKPTGLLTVWQIYNLERRFDMQKLSSVLFPDEYRSLQTDEFATVKGTMTILDEKILWPINHVTVTCYKSENYCQLDRISLSVPDENSWAQKFGVSQHLTEYYNITRWTKDSIDAIPQETADSSDNCRTTSMNFNFKTNEFFYITRNAGGNCEVLGTTLDKLAKPRIAQIVDGSKIIQEKFAEVEKAAYDVLSSDFRRRVDKTFPEEAKKK